MGYKCTPQLTGLVRGEPKPGAKHRANGRKITEEAGNERYSKSETLDRTRSINNDYEGYKSGSKCWDEMEEEAANYRVKGKTKNGKDYERGLRSDAVIGYAVIFNPPAEMCEGWTQDDYKRFYRDSWTVMNQIEPRLFRGENIKMKAVHRDEGLMDNNGEYGEHMHVIGTAKDNDKYCGNIIDASLYVRINENYPKMMRAKGWDLDDLDTTDFSRMGKDAEYRAERNAKRKLAGRSVNQYRADKAKEIDRMYQDAEEIYNRVMEQTAEIEKKEAELDYREKRCKVRESDLKKREMEIAKREQEAAKKATENAETASAIRNVAIEIQRMYKDAQEQYLKDQAWAGEEYRKHIRERNAAYNQQQKQLGKAISSVAPKPAAKPAGQNPQKSRRLPDMDNIRKPQHDDYSL